MRRPLLLLLLSGCAGSPAPAPPDVAARPAAPERDGSWILRLDGPGAVHGSALAVGNRGEVYVTGSYTVSVDLGGGPVQAMGGERADGFIASYEPDGTHRWSRRFGDVDDDLGVAVAWSGRELGLLGAVRYGAELGGATLIADREHRGTPAVQLLARYTSDGALRGTTRLEQPGPAAVRGLSAGRCGFTVAGVSRGVIEVGGQAVEGGETGTAFVACAGARSWRRLIEAQLEPQTDLVNALVTGTPHGPVLALRFRGQVDLGGGPRGQDDTWSDLLIGLTSRGDHRFSSPLRSERVIDIAADRDGRIALLGADAGGGQRVVTAVDTAGNHRWTVEAPRAQAVSWSPNGEVVTAEGIGRVVLVARAAEDGRVRRTIPVLPAGYPQDLIVTGDAAYVLVDVDGTVALGDAHLESQGEGAALLLRVVNPTGRLPDVRPVYQLLDRPRPGGSPTAGAQELAVAEAPAPAPAPNPAWSEDEQRVVALVRADARTRHHYDVNSVGLAILERPEGGAVVVHHYRYGRWPEWKGLFLTQGQWEQAQRRANGIDTECRMRRGWALSAAETHARELQARADETHAEADVQAAQEAWDAASAIEGDPNGDSCRGAGWRQLFGEDHELAARCVPDRVVIRVQELVGTDAEPRLGRVLASHEIETCINHAEWMPAEPEPGEEAAPDAPPAPPTARLTVADVDGDGQPEAVVRETLEVDTPLAADGHVSLPSESMLWVVSARGALELELSEAVYGDSPVEPNIAFSHAASWRLIDLDGNGTIEAVRRAVRFRRPCGCADLAANPRWAAFMQDHAESPVRWDVPYCGTHDRQVSGAPCVDLGEPSRRVLRYDPEGARWVPAEE